jgi:actin-related protein
VDNYLDGNYAPEEELQMEDFINEMMELSSDCEKYEVQLLEVEGQIKEMEPTFDEDHDNEDLFLFNKYNNLDKINFGMDITRSCEGLFKPYLHGMDNQGLTESLSQIIRILSQDIQKKILKNIYLVGGGAALEGLPGRLKLDLENRFAFLKAPSVNRGVKFNVCNPAMHEIVKLWKSNEEMTDDGDNEESIVEIHVLGDSLGIGFNGMCRFIRDFDNKTLQNLMISKEEYFEYGPYLFKPGLIGNI